jgi:hypothetical protein
MREACAKVENGLGRSRVDVIVGRAVVVTEEKSSGRANAARHASPDAAQLLAVVARVTKERGVPFVESEIEAQGFGVESIRARVGAEKIVSSLRVARLIGQRVELQIAARDCADALHRNDVVRKRRAHDAVADAHGSQRVVNLYA